MTIFRNATIEDLPEIISIYNSTIASRMVTADTEPVTVDEKIIWFNDHNDTRPLLAMEENNKMVGWMSFNNFYGRPAYRHTAEISIYIHESERGKGFGKVALIKAIEVSPGLKIKNLLGFIFAHNIASLNLFYKVGFEKWAYLPGVAILDNMERDLIILGKRII